MSEKVTWHYGREKNGMVNTTTKAELKPLFFTFVKSAAVTSPSTCPLRSSSFPPNEVLPTISPADLSITGAAPVNNRRKQKQPKAGSKNVGKKRKQGNATEDTGQKNIHLKLHSLWKQLRREPPTMQI
jgi:hypothetical protein